MNRKVEAVVRAAGTKLGVGYTHCDSCQEKERYHLVTELDGEIDDFIRRGLIELYPDSGIYSEESRELISSSGDRWIVGT
jgi:fructose-1,6-bisphosphatase/inositol monophosphatase family enzyme